MHVFERGVGSGNVGAEEGGYRRSFRDNRLLEGGAYGTEGGRYSEAGLMGPPVVLLVGDMLVDERCCFELFRAEACCFGWSAMACPLAWHALGGARWVGGYGMRRLFHRRVWLLFSG